MEKEPKRIIRGTQVEGVVFFDPNSPTSPEVSNETKAQTIAKMHEVLRQKMGENKDYPKELEEIWKEGENEGYRRGLLDGQAQGYEVGKEEAFETGLREGMQKTRNELKHLVQLVNTVALGLATKQEGIFEQIRPEIIKFILNVCEHMLRRSLTDSKSFIQLIELLLHETKSILKDGVITVVMASEDLELFERDLQKLSYDRDEIKKLCFVVDKAIERGNCRVETSLGLVNFDIKRMLADLEKKVLEVEMPE